MGEGLTKENTPTPFNGEELKTKEMNHPFIWGVAQKKTRQPPFTGLEQKTVPRPCLWGWLKSKEKAPALFYGGGNKVKEIPRPFLWGGPKSKETARPLLREPKSKENCPTLPMGRDIKQNNLHRLIYGGHHKIIYTDPSHGVSKTKENAPARLTGGLNTKENAPVLLMVPKTR